MPRSIERLAFPNRPIPGESPTEARLSAMMLAMLSEMTIMRERIDTLERLLEARGGLARADIETYVAQGAEAAERDALRQRMIGKVFRPYREELERAARKAEGDRHLAEDPRQDLEFPK